MLKPINTIRVDHNQIAMKLGSVCGTGRVECLANEAGESAWTKWFLEEWQIALKNALPDERILCVPGYKKDSSFWMDHAQAFSQFPTVHSGHYDIGKEDFSFQAFLVPILDSIV